MMEQRRAINALEPFVLLSKSATSSRGAADLIRQATSSPNTYVFAELLQTPNIQALRNAPEYSSHLTLLEIFSHGTYADYLGSFVLSYNTQSSPKLTRPALTSLTATSNLPTLDSKQIQKLQFLSLISLASQHSPLTYTSLQAALSLPDATALESLVSAANAASLLSGTLDPQEQLVYIDSVAPLRDLAPASLPVLASQIRDWSERCATVLKQLEAEQDDIRAKARQRTDEQRRIDGALESRIAQQDQQAVGTENQGPGKTKRGSVGDGGEDAMDVDVDDGLGGAANSSGLSGKKGVKRAFGMLKSGGK